MKEKAAERGQYSEVVARLEQIVRALEAGELSLEESLERFGEGVKLVKQGEQLLSEAEKRVEQLLSDDGRTAPLKVPEGEAPSAAAKVAPPKRAPAPAPGPDDDDVPF